MEALHFFTILMISFVLSLPSLFQFSWAAHIENISQTQSLIDDGSKTTLISPGQIFELGYFSPGNSKKRYLGIWYKRKPETVVWIANRNSPLNDSNGEFTIREGKLVLLNSTGSSIWSPDASSNAANGPVALLLDTGNLILKEQESAKDDAYIWKSFDYPTDTLLNGMKLGWDLTTGFERHLTSWKSADDPSTGNITYRISIISGLSQTILAEGPSRKYRSGVWNGVRFNGVTTLLVKTNFKIVSVFNETDAYIMIESTVNYSTISLVKLNYSGLLQHLVLQNDNSEWTVMYTVPTDQQCEIYSYCGANAMCTSSKYPVLCDCLEGYTPRSQEEWRALTWSKGCKRKVALDCSEGEGFVVVSGVKIPDLLEFSFNKNMSLKECKKACLKNCSCIAYANSYITKGSSGCLMWFGDLIDIRYMEVKEGEEDFYVRLSASEMKSIRDTIKKKKRKVVLLASLMPGTFILCVAIWCIRRKLRKRVKGESNNEDVDLPTFDLAAIVAATNNFSPENMIGAGGFGPVYKGKLSTGQEIAVKRLSKNSRQGLKEFKNEVELIAKLQHRNLVALLGCCIQKEERILIYEYMPNKSLDHYIFDCKRCITLPWKKHFDIIRGIARGLLYLHQDSKLRIVHRDLKASNILLDSNLDPKISDFGLARIFRDEEREEKTRRIVGTYGYISPEYAIDGMFSVKSDVFSFGVVLLETVSGKKNRNFRHPSHNHNLLGHAWLLWNEGKALDLMNPCFKDSYVEYQVLRSIQVGLLCVQQFSYNRPTMSSVVFMLENESALLPQPKQPGFFVERSLNDDFITSTTYQESYSENVATVTMPYGR